MKQKNMVQRTMRQMLLKECMDRGLSPSTINHIVAPMEGKTHMEREQIAVQLLEKVKSGEFDTEEKVDYTPYSKKLQVGPDTSPRALLANAFEGVVQNDIERRKLEKYQSRVAELDAEEAKLKELRVESRDPGTVRDQA